jgi:hypothetical protein
MFCTKTIAHPTPPYPTMPNVISDVLPADAPRNAGCGCELLNNCELCSHLSGKRGPAPCASVRDSSGGASPGGAPR